MIAYLLGQAIRDDDEALWTAPALVGLTSRRDIILLVPQKHKRADSCARVCTHKERQRHTDTHLRNPSRGRPLPRHLALFALTPKLLGRFGQISGEWRGLLRPQLLPLQPDRWERNSSSRLLTNSTATQRRRGVSIRGSLKLSEHLHATKQWKHPVACCSV